MKVKYILIFIILLVIGNYLRLLVEDKNIPDIKIKEEVVYQKENAKKENDLSKSDKKFDVNLVEFDELLKLGFSKSKAEKLIEYREEVGIISNLEELKNVPKFGESGLKVAKQYLYVDAEKIKNSFENYKKEYKKFNINKLNENDLKKLGFSKKEIKKILEKKGEIRSNIDLEEIIGEAEYIKIQERIKFSD